MIKNEKRPRLINGKVTNGYIDGSLFTVEKQPSKETLKYLNSLFVGQVMKTNNKECLWKIHSMG